MSRADFSLPGSNATWPVESFEGANTDMRQRCFRENERMSEALGTILDWTRCIAGPSSIDTHRKGQDIAPRSRLCGEFVALVKSIKDQVDRINEEVKSRGLHGNG